MKPISTRLLREITRGPIKALSEWGMYAGVVESLGQMLLSIELPYN